METKFKIELFERNQLTDTLCLLAAKINAGTGSISLYSLSHYAHCELALWPTSYKDIHVYISENSLAIDKGIGAMKDVLLTITKED